ncbi:MAG: hypothetical protein J7J91_09635 [Deltaproteobacteria bacterium]|nr:hypothetical protein [Deltaproteobacteria bacterium]
MRVLKDRCKKSKYEIVKTDFETRFKIIDFMINAKEPVSPKMIAKGTGIRHYPTINYHLHSLYNEGFIIPLGSNFYTVQPFILHNKKINKYLKKAVDEAFKKFVVCHFFGSCEECDQKIRVELFRNAFLYYVNWLLRTGKF